MQVMFSEDIPFSQILNKLYYTNNNRIVSCLYTRNKYLI